MQGGRIMNLSEKLLKLRKQSGLSQQELADQLNVSKHGSLTVKYVYNSKSIDRCFIFLSTFYYFYIVIHRNI